MTLATVFTKTVRDRWVGAAVGSLTMAVFLLFGMSVYSGIDLSLYTDLPESMRVLMNIGDDVDAGSLAYSAIYSMMGAFTMSALAISMGSRSIAGEERDGTIGLLLGNPISRDRVLTSKAAAMAALIAACVGVLWLGGLAVPKLLDVDVTEMHVGALLLHMLASALFYGFLALAIGALTGRGSVASGVAAGVMVASYLAVSLLPLLEGWGAAAKVFPWYYYEGSDPLRNGVDWVHLTVLVVAAASLFLASLAWVDRRDLRGRNTGVTLLDRLRSQPSTRRVADRLAGSTRVSHVWTKAATEHQGVLTVTIVTMVFMGVIMGPFYALMDDDLKSMSDQLGDTMTALIGGVDMGTAEGFIQAETFAITAPIAFITLTAIMGSRAVAGEEANHTMGLLLSSPISRSRVIVEKALAIIVNASLLGLATFLGSWVGIAVADLDIAVGNLFAVSLNATLLGIAFGALALALGAGSGRSSVASYGTTGVAFASYLAFSFLPLSDRFAGWERVSPFYYYLGSDPLVNGLNWAHAALLAGLAVALVAVSLVAFERRDLR